MLIGVPSARAAGINADDLQADLRFFTTASCSQLLPSMKRDDLAGFKSEALRSVASAMLDGTYDRTYRVARYQAYPSPRELGETLKLGDGFSRYENKIGRASCRERV